MYELGAASKFCTSIAVISNDQAYLGRNLDYGYQEYLINNSLHFQYQRKGEIIFEVMGHAGLIGAHTAIRLSKEPGSLQFGIVLNEREVGGLHETLYAIATRKCETSPYNVMKLLKSGAKNL
jgi:hypothetical protein